MGALVSRPPQSHGLHVKTNADDLWEGCEIRWDQTNQAIQLLAGEKSVTREYCGVEDAKGKNGCGRMIFTQLRGIWKSETQENLNLSIGLGCIRSIQYNFFDSHHFGRIRSTCIIAYLNSACFEFVFSIKEDTSLQFFNDFQMAIRRYQATSVYRDLILRDKGILKDGRIRLEVDETLIKTIDACDNLTPQEAHLGVLTLTNLRLIWVSNDKPEVNLSVPFLQLRSATGKVSSFGATLVLETSQISGGYVLGFRFSDNELFREIVELVRNGSKEFKANPFFGPTEGTFQLANDRFIVTRHASEPLIQTPRQTSSVEPDVHHAMRGDTEELNSKALLRTSMSAPDMDRVAKTKKPTLRSAQSELVEGRFEPLADVVGGACSSLRQLDLNNETHKALPSSSYKAREVTVSPSSRKYIQHIPKCVVCLATPDEVALDPCGHVCVCQACAKQLTDCPICRAAIEKVLKIYITA